MSVKKKGRRAEKKRGREGREGEGKRERGQKEGKRGKEYISLCELHTCNM